jgi:hypothetical protein
MLQITAQLDLRFKSGMVPDVFSINGEAFMLTKLGDTQKAMIKGTAGLSYDFSHNIIDGYATLEAAVGKKEVAGLFLNGEMRLHIAIDEGKFFFKLGDPEKRISTEAYLASIQLFKMGTYFMVGNYDMPPLPKPYGLTDEQIQQIFGTIRQTPYDEVAMGSSLAGMAFGAGFSINTGKQTVGPLYFEFLAGAGFDLMIKQYTEGCNGKNDLPGINGWYAIGQVYAYLKLKAGIHVDVWVYEGDIDILEISAAALLRGGFVNPTWVSGNIKGRFSVLNGLVEGSINEEFTIGDICVPQRNPFANKPLIVAVNPITGANAVNIMTPVEVDFNYPINDIIEIEAQKADGKGSEIQRYQLTFKADKQFVFTSSANAQDCTPTNEGEVYYSQNNYRATFYRAQALQPKSNYQVTVGVQMNKLDATGRRDLTWKYAKDAQKDTTVSFRTGECLSALSKKSSAPSLVANYPYDNQRYFLPGEGDGFLELAAEVCCILPANDQLYDLKAQFITTGDTLETAATANGKFINYRIPMLKGATIYKLRVIKKPKPNFMALIRQQQGTATAKESSINNKYASTAQISQYTAVKATAISAQNTGTTVKGEAKKVPTTSFETNKNGNKVTVRIVRGPDGSVSYQPQAVVLYQYHFQTSQFRKASEKLKAITNVGNVADKATLKGNDFWGYGINYTAPEGFDVYDLGYQPVRFAGDKREYKWPMFVFSDGGNRWGNEFRKPLYQKYEGSSLNGNVNLIPMSKYTSADGINIRSAQDLQNRMLIEPRQGEPPLSGFEIKTRGPVERSVLLQLLDSKK